MARLAVLSAAIAAVRAGDILSVPTVSSGVDTSTVASWTTAADNAWTAYVQAALSTYSNEGIQPHCMPRKFPASASATSYKGVIVLIHGYSACPSQFYDWIPLLTDQGYTVLTPLIPGHGLKYSWQPTYRNCGPWWAPWRSRCLTGYVAQERYGHMMTSPDQTMTFVNTLNDIVKLAPGIRVVGGLSFGGAIATLVGATTYNSGASRLYDRQFLSVSFYDFANSAYTAVFAAAAWFPWTANQEFGWGAACEGERLHGRSGICSFQIKHMNNARKTGEQIKNVVQSHYGSSSTPIPWTQVMYVEGDGAVKNAKIRELTNAMTSTRVSSCAFRAPVDHSYGARGDHPNTNMFWVAELGVRVSAFLVQEEYAFSSSNWPEARTVATDAFEFGTYAGGQSTGCFVSGTVPKLTSANSYNWINTHGSSISAEANEPQCALLSTADNACGAGWNNPFEQYTGTQVAYPGRDNTVVLATIPSTGRRLDGVGPVVPIPSGADAAPERIDYHEKYEGARAARRKLQVAMGNLSYSAGGLLWTQHVEEWLSHHHQKGCMPITLAAQGTNVYGASVPYGKGIVMLFHGFAVCPNTLLELGEAIAAKGYMVHIPLLPGHGRYPTEIQGVTITDDVSDLPHASYLGANTQEYFALVERMNAVMAGYKAEYPGLEYHVGGLSLGATLAHRATVVEPALYGRSLIISPFWELANSSVGGTFSQLVSLVPDNIRGVNGSDPVDMSRALSGWDDVHPDNYERCEKERQQGWSGFCKFEVGHVTAALEMGNATVDEPLPTQTQLVGVFGDPFVSFETMLDKAPVGKACFYSNGAGHSLPVDELSYPWTPKWWQKSFVAHAANYFADGTQFPFFSESGVSYPLCSLVEPDAATTTHLQTTISNLQATISNLQATVSTSSDEDNKKAYFVGAVGVILGLIGCVLGIVTLMKTSKQGYQQPSPSKPPVGSATV